MLVGVAPREHGVSFAPTEPHAEDAVLTAASLPFCSRAKLSSRLRELEHFVEVVSTGLTRLVPTQSTTANDDATCANLPTPSQSSTNANLRSPMRRCTVTHGQRYCVTSFENILTWARTSLVDDHGLVPGSDEALYRATPAAVEEETDSDSIATLLEAGQSITLLEEGVAHALIDAAASDSLVMYPCLELRSVREHLDTLLALANDSQQQTTLALRLIDIEILKMVLLVGASSNASSAISGNDAVAWTLQSSIAWTVESALLHDVISVEDVMLSCLMVGRPDYPCKSSK